MALPNGIRSNYQYDNLNRLTSLSQIKLSNQSVVSSYAYTLLADGRRSSVTEVYDGTTTQLAYTYDNLNRLTGESRQVGMGSPTATTYTYDLVGNRVKKHDGTYETTYTYNDRDELTLEESTDSDPLKDVAYTYDTNGSLIAKDYANDSVDEDEFTYDVEQRLIAATLKRTEDSQSVEITTAYRYNHQGIRVKADQTAISVASVAGTPVQRRYLIDPFNHTGYAQVLEERDGSNAPRTTYTIGHDVLSQASPSGGPSGGLGQHLLYDGHGTTRHLTNSSATVVESYNYDSYGNIISATYGATNQPQTNHLYTGEQYDTDLRQTYLRARYYDSSSGRFNRVDPFAGNRYDPQSLHKYAYVHGDPVNAIDPSGHFTMSERLVSSFIQGILRTLNFGFKVYRGYSKVSDVLDIIDTGRMAVRFIRALDAVTPEAAGLALYGEIRRSFGEEGLEALSQGLGGALGTLNEHWEDARKAITEKIPEMSSRAAAGVAPHIPTLMRAHANKDLKYVISLPSAPGNYDTSSKRTIPLGRKLVVEVTPTGGSLFGLSLQYGLNQRVPVIRVDYWDVRATTANKINLHYHTLPNMKGDHHPIWTAPGVHVP